jgi:hypothetical protein
MRQKGGYGSAAAVPAAFDERKAPENISSSELHCEDNNEPSFFIRWITRVVYDPENPEFTAAQQTTWAVLIGFLWVLSQHSGMSHLKHLWKSSG